MTNHQKAGLMALAYMTTFLMLALTLWATDVYTVGQAVRMMAIATLSLVLGYVLGRWSAALMNQRNRRR